MNALIKLFIPVILVFFSAGTVDFAAAQDHTSQRSIFQPLTQNESPGTRTSSGKPGPDYWQNETDYMISVRLDSEKHRIDGIVEIEFTNHSPDELDFVWLLLEQNLFSRDSKGARATPVEGGRFGNVDFDGGYELYRVLVTQDGENYEPEYIVTDTRMQLRLKNPVEPKGGKLTIKIDYGFKIPEYGSDRMGRMEFENGWVYTIAQWYPNLAVYDDINGWNTRPYLGAGEFYRNFGDIEYEITVPGDFIVVGSGELVNPEEVLPQLLRDRLDEALESDTTRYIIAPDEIGSPEIRPEGGGELTWRFSMENTRDVAWAASPGFIWDASGIPMPSGRRVMAMSAYPVESDGSHAWGRSTEYTRESIRHYSEMWYEYPWPAAVNVAGIVGGMEYPGLSFCSWRATGRALWSVTDHEFGHNWFPMIVASNERKWMWMDEGPNTFINHLSTLAFNEGEYAPRFESSRDMVRFILARDMEPIMTPADAIRPENLGFVAYFKPTMGFLMLRDFILGPERFDYAFRTYIERWAYKHPTPMDLFRTMNDVSGENLDWFWKGWFYENYRLDQRVDFVDHTEVDGRTGALITIGNHGELVMPVELEITLSGGETHRKRLPVEVWKKGNEWILFFETDARITRVEIDPDRLLPLIQPEKAIWEPS